MPTEKPRLASRPTPTRPNLAPTPSTATTPRPTAPRRRSTKRRGVRYWIAICLGLPVLLLLPGRAIERLTEQLAPLHISTYFALISSITIWQLSSDKRAAQNDQRRVPEIRLHFLELIGGWPASYLAQRVLRHKTAKSSYQTSFWLLVALHQYAAFDFMQDWQWSVAVHAFIEPIIR